MMKKTILRTALLACIIGLTACEGKEKPITVNELPTKAQQTITTHFAAEKVALAKVDNEMFDKEYEVTFASGNQLEFDKEGKVTKVECKTSQVPELLIPETIREFLHENYPQEKVLKMSRDHRGYDLDLTNRIELEFSPECQLVDID